MNICTFNVNSIRTRKDLILDWLDHRGDDIDVLCFQEIKVVDELFPKEEFSRRGFQTVILGQKGYAGVAICSRVPIDQIERGMDDPAWDQQKRVLSVNLAGLTLINIYAPHGGARGEEKFEYKIDWYRRFMDYLDKRHSPGDALILTGDFNVTRKDRDVYDPEVLADSIGTMPEEREAFSRLLNWGLTDLYRHHHPETRQFTWWAYMGGAIWKDEGMRIDYVLCSAPLLKRTTGIEVDLWPRKRRSPTPSDHAPLILSLEEPA